jgi:hypothetical protein
MGPEEAKEEDARFLIHPTLPSGYQVDLPQDLPDVISFFIHPALSHTPSTLESLFVIKSMSLTLQYLPLLVAKTSTLTLIMQLFTSNA